MALYVENGYEKKEAMVLAKQDQAEERRLKAEAEERRLKAEAEERQHNLEMEKEKTKQQGKKLFFIFLVDFTINVLQLCFYECVGCPYDFRYSLICFILQLPPVLLLVGDCI